MLKENFKNFYVFIRILFTKKRLMKDKKLQYLFNLIFKPISKRKLQKEINELLK